jgi:hypothetical protein
MLYLMFAKVFRVIVKAVFINLFDILPKIYGTGSCQAKYTAGYPVYDLFIGKNSLVHP